MDSQSDEKWFNDIEAIISEPLKFKAKLNIGEDVYTSLKIKKAAGDVWETLGASTAGMAIANSSIVASTFFAPTGFWAAIGLGGAAATPIGWVVAAGLVTGGAWVGVSRYVKKATDSRVTVIPKFINTPIDVLGLGLFDLLAPLSLKVADADGEIVNVEETLIHNYFVNEWGYDQKFVAEGLQYTKANLSNFSIVTLAKTLADFATKNPDCNYKSLTKEVINFLNDVMEVDGIIHEQEEISIELINTKFSECSKFKFDSYIKTAKEKAKTLKNRAEAFKLPKI